jgi:hypothetical protein
VRRALLIVLIVVAVGSVGAFVVHRALGPHQRSIEGCEDDCIGAPAASQPLSY